jgi:hypothetical protein
MSGCIVAAMPPSRARSSSMWCVIASMKRMSVKPAAFSAPAR